MPRETAGAGWMRTDVLNYIPEATDLTGVGALDLTVFTPGFAFEIEEFGFRVSTALVGGANLYDLVDVNNGVLATITLTAAAGGKAAVVKAPAITGARGVIDATVIKIRRRVGGTTVSAGTGSFYVRGRMRMQQRN